MAPNGFNEQVSLCRSTLAMLRQIDDEKRHRLRRLVGINWIDAFLYYAHEMGATVGHQLQFGLVEAIAEVVGNWDISPVQGMKQFADYWCAFIPTFIKQDKQLLYLSTDESAFIRVAVRYNLRHYVTQVLETDPSRRPEQGTPLLAYALLDCRWISTQTGLGEIQGHVDLDLVKYLISTGSDPNEKFGQRKSGEEFRAWVGTPTICAWAAECLAKQERKDLLDSKNWFTIAKMLVENGGSLSKTIKAPLLDQIQELSPIPVSRAFERLFST